jgi:pyrroline-5-carboxylate reductase
MGQALLGGLRRQGVSSSRLCVVETNAARASTARRRFGVETISMERLAQRCHVVILAVKPQDLKPVMIELREWLKKSRPRVLVISIAAGVQTASIERVMGRVPVVRVMPNLPATVGCGMAVLTTGRFATSADLAVAKAIFRCVGEIVELPQRFFDVVTAFSGLEAESSAGLYRALRDAGVRHGLPAEIAQRLAVQTALGSAQLASHINEELETLIARVASKKGTTEAALKVFARRGLARIIQEGVAAAARRSHRLSAEVSDTAGV